MIPFYRGSETDCSNCIYWKRKNESGEMFCKEEHRTPKPWEHCEFQKNEYQWKLEIIDDWISNGMLTEERKEQALVWREEYDEKKRKQKEHDQRRREEEKKIDQNGLETLLGDSFTSDS